MLERVQAARTSFELVVAATTEAADEGIASLCRRMDVSCFQGHPTDLLDRHYRAAVDADADVVVKIPSDCPLIDPAAIDRVLAFYRDNASRYDFVSNLHPATYPDGNDVEVLSFAALEAAWREATRGLEREHTTPFVWDQPHRFRIGNVRWETGQDYSMTHRFTVDYPEDYAFVAAIYEALWRPSRPVFTLPDILRLLDEHPQMYRLNARYAGVNWYRHHLDELRTVRRSETRSPEVGG
jgi:spore coat polysaccharide biosynthesis protein SpsF